MSQIHGKHKLSYLQNHGHCGEIVLASVKKPIYKQVETFQCQMKIVKSCENNNSYLCTLFKVAAFKERFEEDRTICRTRELRLYRVSG